MQGGLMDQGLELMVFGMGTVVVFLTLLVGATTAMSALIQRFFSEDEDSDWAAAGAPAVRGDRDDPRLVAVITAALAQHRNSNRKP